MNPLQHYKCNSCKYSWYQEKADKCPNCGSKNITVEREEEEGLIF